MEGSSGKERCGNPNTAANPRRVLLRVFYNPDFIHAAARQIEPPVRSRDHVAHDAPARGNRRARKCLRARIESDKGVRRDAGFAVPDHTICGYRYAVGLRTGTTGRWPLLGLVSGGVTGSQIAPGPIAVEKRFLGRPGPARAG